MCLDVSVKRGADCNTDLPVVVYNSKDGFIGLVLSWTEENNKQEVDMIHVSKPTEMSESYEK